MSYEQFLGMMRYVGFAEADAARLRQLGEILRPKIQDIVAEFYAVIARDPEARSVVGPPAQVRRLHESLYRWLESVFEGRFDETYFASRCRIGRTHVRVQLPQRYMFTAMNVIRRALISSIPEQLFGTHREHVLSLHKILDLELAIMNESYRDDLIQKMKDIEKGRFEQRLSEAQHLATIGQLAASLAHEIKNPLAGISGAIQVLGAHLDPHHPHQEVIAEVLRQIDRLDAAVRDLLIYARPKPPERSRVNVSRTLARTLMLLREEPSFKRIELECCGIEAEHVASVDESQIQEVITNLMLNAVQACDGKGKITCAVQRLGEELVISIVDNGAGIPSSVLPRVFEPFFTTKARGTGLGLPICRRIVEIHGGRLDLESKLGVGTKVTMALRCEP